MELIQKVAWRSTGIREIKIPVTDTLKKHLSAADTSVRLGYKEIMYDISGDEVCFYISAVEAANPHGVTGQSNSQEICTSPEEIITVPNLFTPDNDLLNDFFRPVLRLRPGNTIW